MLFYTHLVWSLDLENFFRPHGWLSPEAVQTVSAGNLRLELLLVISTRPQLLWTRAHRGAGGVRPAHARPVQPHDVGPGLHCHAVVYRPRARRAVRAGPINVMLAHVLDARPGRSALLVRSLGRKRAPAEPTCLCRQA